MDPAVIDFVHLPDDGRRALVPPAARRPGGSAQYGLAIQNFDDPENPARFRFGFLASSDNHSARPGTGYKQFAI
jgi:hypothetical protein